MGLDRAPIEFQTFYFSHVCVTPPSAHHQSLIYIIHIIMSKMYHHNLANIVKEGVPT